MAEADAKVDNVTEIIDACWKDKLLNSRGKTVLAMLAHGKMISEFYQACERTKGGTSFSKKMNEWLGYDKPLASRWKMIGDNYDELLCKTQQLPSAEFTLMLLAGMKSEDREKIMHPNVTQQEVKRAINASKAPKPPKPKLATKPKTFPWREVVLRKLGGNLPKGFPRDLHKRAGKRGEPISQAEEILGHPFPADFSRFEEDEEEATAVAKSIKQWGVEHNPKQVEEEAQQEIKKTKEQVKESDRERFTRLLQQATEAEIKNLQAKFQTAVREKVQKETEEQRAELNRQQMKALEEISNWAERSKCLDEWMTQEEYKLVLGCLHPDKHHPDEQARYSKAFHIFKRLEIHVNSTASKRVKNGWAK